MQKPVNRAKRVLAATLATMVTGSFAFGQATGTSSQSESGIQVLSPFTVKDDKDFGYLKTNAATATKIGMEIQNVPLNISVISRDFLDDTNAKSLTDLFRYTAAASGDTRFAMRVPANEATPQGGFTMRGFQVNTLMRNGVFRYISHNFDNIDRVEVVKGPATVFFGQGYPGGVINFVTKRPSFSPLATEVSYTVNNDSGERVNIDHNAVLSKKAAVRFVGGWEDSQGERRFEFKKSITASPSLTLVPFDSGKVKINLELEYSNKQYNQNDYDWIYSDFEGWRKAAAAGPFLSSVIAASAGNGLAANVTQATTTPTLAYSTYINNIRNATGNLMLPAYTSVKRGAYYTDAGGKWIYDKAFNYTSRGAKSMELDEVVDAEGHVTRQGQEYYLKPMNCPFHLQVYKRRTRSYRELPLRYNELGTVYRYEPAGTLHGLLRTRGFTQDDSHIFCRPDQLGAEVNSVLDLGLKLWKTFGFSEYHIELAVRDPANLGKYLGEDARWVQAEAVLKEALDRKSTRLNSSHTDISRMPSSA